MSYLPAMAGNTQRVPRGMATLQLEGSPYERPLGSCKISFELKAEILDLRTNELAERPIVDQVVTDLNGDIDVEAFSADAFIMAIAHSAVPFETFTQPAVVNGSKTFTDVREGDRATLKDANGRQLYAVTLSNVEPAGAAVIDPRTGRIAFTADAAEVEVTYAATAITAAEKHAFIRLFSQPIIRGRFSLTQDNAVGTNYEYTIPRVSLYTSGSIAGVANDGSQSSMPLKMKILLDTREPADRQRGWMKAIGRPGA